jgi:hypothetical protein
VKQRLLLGTRYHRGTLSAKWEKLEELLDRTFTGASA